MLKITSEKGSVNSFAVETAMGTGRAPSGLGCGSRTPSADVGDPRAQHSGCCALARFRDASLCLDSSAPAPSANVR